MKYSVFALVDMTGSYRTEIEADTLEDAKAIAEELSYDLDINDVCWSEEIYPYLDCEVSLAEEEDEDF